VSGELLFRLILYGALAIAILVLVVVSLRRHARAGFRLSDPFRQSRAVVELALDEGAADALCKRALLEVNETRTARRFKERKLRVLSHLDKKEPGAITVSFELAPAEERRTRVTVSIYPGRGQLALGITRKRKALAERLAAWLAEHGNGRVVELGWGRPFR
jgi:hypothetical protein